MNALARPSDRGSREPRPAVVAVPASIPSRCGDLIDLIAYRIALVDDLAAAWERRRAARPAGQRIYRDRVQRAHRERMAAATAFQRGENHV